MPAARRFLGVTSHGFGDDRRELEEIAQQNDGCAGMGDREGSCTSLVDDHHVELLSGHPRVGRERTKSIVVIPAA